MTKNNIEQIYSLDLLRIIAAVVVFVFHLSIRINIKTSLSIIDNFISNGAVVMVIFFMLSGFLLYISNQNNDLNDNTNLSVFYKKRIIRIYPAYIFYTLMFYFGLGTPILYKFLLLPNEIFMLQGFNASTNNYLGNSASWFISTIFVIYLLFPFLQRIINMLKHKLIYIILVLYLLSVYATIINVYFDETRLMSLYINPIFRLCEFIIGMCIAAIYIKNKDKVVNIIYPIILGIILIILVGILAKNNFLNHYRFDNHYSYYNVVVVPLSALIIYTLACVKNKFVVNFSKSYVIQYLSKLSFSFFLMQGWTFAIFKYIQKHYILSDSKICLILTLINSLLAVLMYEIVEKKVGNYLKSKYIEKSIN